MFFSDLHLNLFEVKQKSIHIFINLRLFLRKRVTMFKSFLKQITLSFFLYKMVTVIVYTLQNGNKN